MLNLICTVRGCGQPLTREAQRVTCPRGHSFDIARSGYINLLQPQDKKSKEPGDSASMVQARRRLHDRGITRPLYDAIATLLQAERSEASIVDVGCGDGYYLGTLASETGCRACGIDLSIPAIDAAARRYPHCEWIVANADRLIPYADASFTRVMSITGRQHAPELRRVLAPEGRLLIAIPAPDDLIELRGAGRDRTARTIAECAPHFRLIDQRRATTHADLDTAAVADVLASIYRPLTPARATRVTFSLDLLVFMAH